MGKITILRLAEDLKSSEGFKTKDTGTSLKNETKFSSQLEINLKKILGEFQLEYYSKIPNLKHSYERRIESLQKSFLFVLDTIPELKGKKAALKKYLSWCQLLCALPRDEPIEKYQEILARYTGLLVNALVDNYPSEATPVERVRFATELLNKAEQYVIMKEGRSDLATLIPIRLNESVEYVLRWEKQLAPYSEETFQEFSAIKKGVVVTTPKWFRALSPLMQTYLHSCIPEYVMGESREAILSKLKFSLNQFTIKWHEIKLQQGMQLSTELSGIANDKFPTWYTALPPHEQRLVKLFCDSQLTAEKITSQLSTFSKQIKEWTKESSSSQSSVGGFNARELNDLRAVTYWFLVLDDHEQYFLKEVLESSKRVEDVISFAPSRLRRLPLVANFCESNLLLLSKEGKLIKKYPSRLRLSHMASRDVIKLPPQIKKLHAARNLARVESFTDGNQPWLMQTLISPVKLLDGHIPDYYLDQARQETVANFQKKRKSPIFSTNHPLNMAKYLYYTPANDPACMALLNMANIILLVNKVPELNAWDLTKIEKVISEVFSEVEADKENQAFNSSLKSGDEDNEIKKNLANLFSENYQLLKSLDGWQQLLAQHLYRREDCCKKGDIGSYWKDLSDLQVIAKEYNAVLNSSYGSATVFDYYGRELYLSSLENLLMMYAQGKSSGSCVSGKDRKEIEIVHTIAMLLYREKKGRWPSMRDSGADRDEFVDLVATVFVSRHGHEHAGQNADGADGIKTPENYWPKDIAEAIRKKESQMALENSDILATNNEVGRIGNLNQLVVPGFSDCVFSAQQLSAENRQKVLDILAILCGEQSFLQSKTWSLKIFSTSMPQGMDEIKKILQSPGIDEAASINKLAKIYVEIKQRPKDSWVRATEIQNLYVALLNLCKEPETKAEESIDLLVKTKEMAFRTNSQMVY